MSRRVGPAILEGGNHISHRNVNGHPSSNNANYDKPAPSYNELQRIERKLKNMKLANKRLKGSDSDASQEDTNRGKSLRPTKHTYKIIFGRRKTPKISKSVEQTGETPLMPHKNTSHTYDTPETEMLHITRAPHALFATCFSSLLPQTSLSIPSSPCAHNS